RLAARGCPGGCPACAGDRRRVAGARLVARGSLRPLSGWPPGRPRHGPRVGRQTDGRAERLPSGPRAPPRPDDGDASSDVPGPGSRVGGDRGGEPGRRARRPELREGGPSVSNPVLPGASAGGPRRARPCPGRDPEGPETVRGAWREICPSCVLLGFGPPGLPV